jgi:hypothetical protein
MTNFLILNEHGDVRFFESGEKLTSWVEAIDVENGEYEVFSSLGHRLNLSAFGEIVTIDPSEGNPTHGDRLREILVEYFSDNEENSQWARNATLSELLDRCRPCTE